VLLSALQWQYVAIPGAEITEEARRCDRGGSRLPIKDWSRRSVHFVWTGLVQAPPLVSCCYTGERPHALSPGKSRVVATVFKRSRSLHERLCRFVGRVGGRRRETYDAHDGAESLLRLKKLLPC
jgi:hypothetical protein